MNTPGPQSEVLLSAEPMAKAKDGAHRTQRSAGTEANARLPLHVDG